MASAERAIFVISMDILIARTGSSSNPRPFSRGDNRAKDLVRSHGFARGIKHTLGKSLCLRIKIQSEDGRKKDTRSNVGNAAHDAYILPGPETMLVYTAQVAAAPGQINQPAPDGAAPIA
jgi:hypothetical protein